MTGQPGSIAIVGTGLMGGSLGLALREAGFNSITGFDSDPAALDAAQKLGAVSRVAPDARSAASVSEIVFIATPIGAIPKVFADIAPGLKDGTIVTDLGSTKSRVVDAIGPLVPEGVDFIGGHPIAGAEQEGIGSADASIFRGCVWILTPGDRTDPRAYGTLVRVLSKLGTKVLSLDAARHDELVALTSHLPQILSSTLMSFTAGPAGLGGQEAGLPLIGAGGFADMTRVAASPSQMWVEIIKDNRDSVRKVLGRFESALGAVARLIEAGEWDALHRMLEDASGARRELPAKPGVAAADLVELLIPVPDRPGVLAEVTTTVGEAGINIEDLRLVHSLEGGRGTIHLVVAAQAAASAQGAIEARGYRVTRTTEASG